MKHSLWVRALALASALLITVLAPFAWADESRPPRTSMRLDVDASEAPMKVLHATLSMPAKPGDMTLLYPKWIPGEHQPSGPVANVTGLHIFADDEELEWRRDRVDMYAIAFTIPPGKTTLTARYIYSVPAAGGAFGAGPSTTAKIAVINWSNLVFYPAGESAADLIVTASLKAPEGWKQGGALDVASTDGAVTHFAPTSLEMLIDHPVLLGEHFRSIPLFPPGSPHGEHAIDVVADSEWALRFPPARIENYKRVVLETRAVFGGVGHYRKYHWLLTLSDHLGAFGVEHHETADDRVAEATFVDDDLAKRFATLLPHEFFHSWNGKALRPAGLLSDGYDKPMTDDLLWVYEGLTTYYGELLAARSGLTSASEWLDQIAANAMDVGGPGRSWRSLQDAADAAPILYTAGTGWAGAQRQTPFGIPPFYAEGSLIWLEADVLIRTSTKGKKTLDDFCARFFGQNDNGTVWVKSYDAEDVYRALDSVAPYDWKNFFEHRLRSKSKDVPLGGVVNGGYKLVYNEVPNFFTDPWKADGSLNAIGSLGVRVLADGTIAEAWPGWPAYQAGISNGMTILAVNGRRFSIDELRRALGDTKEADKPMELIVSNSGFVKMVHVDYRGGIRYPHLERVAGTHDLLTSIAEPRSQSGRK